MSELIISLGSCQKIGFKKYKNKTKVKNSIKKFLILFLIRFKKLLFLISQNVMMKIKNCNKIKIPTILIEIRKEAEIDKYTIYLIGIVCSLLSFFKILHKTQVLIIQNDKNGISLGFINE